MKQSPSGTLVLDGSTYLVIRETPGSRERVLELARLDIGKNLAAEVWTEVNPSLKGKPWCGAWVLCKLRAAGVTSATWLVGVGFVYPIGLKGTKTPKPADIAYQDKPYQHYSLVETPASLNQPLVTLDGNSSGGVVRRVKHLDSRGIIYYSIESLL